VSTVPGARAILGSSGLPFVVFDGSPDEMTQHLAALGVLISPRCLPNRDGKIVARVRKVWHPLPSWALD
jgi:hypothetical protein